MNAAIERWYDEHGPEVIALSDSIWSHPELAFEEHHACEETARCMERWGFSVETSSLGGGSRPNAVVARWGSGRPAIGIIGEYDALANLGQEAIPRKSPVPGPGHGCGHNLMGSGCAAAAAALKAAAAAARLPCQVVYFACPAEETLEGKMLMDRAGYFGGVDVFLAWHPLGRPPAVCEDNDLCCGDWVFEFHGVSAHAAGQPWLGRSALDAAELMNVGVQYLREHVPGDVKIHYSYAGGSGPANVVPDYAALNYVIRANTTPGYEAAVERVQKVARGAACMTETQAEWRLRAMSPESKLNHALNRFLYEAATRVPPPAYSREEYDFAGELFRNAMGAEPPADRELLAGELAEPTGRAGVFPGSSDLTYVMRRAPTASIQGYGTVLNTIGHHWSQTAAAGMSIGHKGALFAGKCLAQCGFELALDPAKVEACWKEFTA